MERILRRYAIGGLTLGIEGPSFPESEYLSPFRMEAAVPDVLFSVEIGHPLLPAEAACRSRELHSGEYEAEGRKFRVLFREKSEELLLLIEELSPSRFAVCLEAQCLPLWDSNLVMKMLDLPTLMLRAAAVFLHSSFIVIEGKAILFTAPKQTGKSTQAELWQAYRGARIINGDRALLRCVDGVWTAFGSPYCGHCDPGSAQREQDPSCPGT